MATSKSWAQEVIICDLCEKAAHRYCNNCQVNLSLDCIIKHIDQLDSLSHDIVPFQNRKLQLVLPVCESHAGQRCEAHCQKCQIPVCTKCLIGLHNGHESEEISTLVDRKRQDIRKETEEIEGTLISKFNSTLENIESKITKIKEVYTKEEQEMQELKPIWIQEVNNIFSTAGSLIQSMKEKDLAVLTTNMSELQDIIRNMVLSVEKNKQIMKTKNACDVINFESELAIYRNIPNPDVDITPHVPVATTSQGKELRLKIEKFNATLTQSSQTSLEADLSDLSTRNVVNEVRRTVENSYQNLMEENTSEDTNGSFKVTDVSGMPKLDVPVEPHISVINKEDELKTETDRDKATHETRLVVSVPVEFNPLWRVACVGADEAWVTGKNDTITRINIQGSVIEKLICQYNPVDISVTGCEDLIYSDEVNRTVNIVSQGKIKKLITARNLENDWLPWGLCSTRSGDILVNLHKQDLGINKIVCYKGTDIIRVIDKDIHGNPIFTNGDYMLYVTENKNGDICIIDRNSETVLIIDSTGTVRSRYDGKTAGRKNSFEPRCIGTDSLGQIIVTDFSNDCLHILHENGDLLICVGNFGLDKPSGLSVDTIGRLWVGLCFAQKIRVIQYLKKT